MQLTFMGTAASEGYPNAFCDCTNCRDARALGGTSLRKRSAALINDDLLIDLGPDLMAAAQMHDVSLARLRYCLQTHEHGDHLDPMHLSSRSERCGVYGVPRLHFYATRGAISRAGGALGKQVPDGDLLAPLIGEHLNLDVHVVEPFQSFELGPYRVRSVRAAHDPNLVPVLYAIERDGRSLFYGTDTGPLPEATWQSLRDQELRFNVVVLDHTFGFGQRSTGHMNAEQFLEQVSRMRSERLLADDARIFAQHLAHHSNPVHPILTEFAAQHGYEVAWDGLTIDV